MPTVVDQEALGEKFVEMKSSSVCLNNYVVEKTKILKYVQFVCVYIETVTFRIDFDRLLCRITG